MSVTCPSSLVGSRVHPDSDTPGHTERRSMNSLQSPASLQEPCAPVLRSQLWPSCFRYLVRAGVSGQIVLCWDLSFAAALMEWSTYWVPEKKSLLFLCGSLGSAPQQLSKGSTKELSFAKIAPETAPSVVVVSWTLVSSVLRPLAHCSWTSVTSLPQSIPLRLHYPSAHKAKGGINHLWWDSPVRQDCTDEC